MGANEQRWDIFIAHAGADLPGAERLYDLLTPQFRVFLDARSLKPGDNWPRVIEQAQNESRVTIVLISGHTDDAYYERDEVVHAIELSRADGRRVIPVFLDGHNAPYKVYGLRSKHGLYVEGGDYTPVAARIADVLSPSRDGNPLQGHAAADPRRQAADFLSIPRIINPPDGEQPQQCTIWLAAAGTDVYTVDSVTIEHLRGNMFSGMTGAVLVDAQYSFHFHYSSKETHALNPALRLDPRDRREVSFTFGLAPDGRFASSGGRVTASLHYHTSRGSQGTLTLAEPSRDARGLAKLLGADVATYEMIVMPTGAQRGRDLDELPPRHTYYRVSYPSTSLSDPLPNPPPRIVLHPSRVAINTALADGDLLPSVIDRLATGDGLAFDLLAGISDQRAADALIAILEAGLHADLAVEALCIRHMIAPDALLADRVAPLAARLAPGRSNEYIVTSLVWHPAGSWVAALLMPPIHPRAFEGLRLRREMLTPAESSAVEDAAVRNLKGPRPEAAAVQFLLWREHSPQDLIGLLSPAEAGHATDPGASADPYKQYLIKTLLSGR